MIDSGNDALMSGLKQSTNPESAKNRPVGTPWQSVTVLPLSRRLNPLILKVGLLRRFLTKACQSERDLPATSSLLQNVFEAGYSMHNWPKKPSLLEYMIILRTLITRMSSRRQ